MVFNKVYYDFRPKTDTKSSTAYSPTVAALMLHMDIDPVVNIPKGVKRIRGYAFYDCWPSEPFIVTVPEGCTEISAMAFANCSMNSVTLPSTITTIADSAFRDCSPNKIIINKPKDSIAGYPWGADGQPELIWKG